MIKTQNTQVTVDFDLNGAQKQQVASPVPCLHTNTAHVRLKRSDLIIIILNSLQVRVMVPPSAFTTSTTR